MGQRRPAGAGGGPAGRAAPLRAAPPRLSAFAVEDTAVQLTWPSLPDGEWRLSAGERGVVVSGDGGPGAAVIDGLPPGTGLVVGVARTGRRPRRAGEVRTLAPPPGRELFRFASVNDVHIGSSGFGSLPAARDPVDGSEPPSVRCARAAVAEAAAWGAQMLVVKGDITEHGRPHEWATAAEALRGGGMPVHAIPGNHDVQRGACDGHAALAAAGIRYVTGGVRSVDVPGLRIVLVDVTVPPHHHGSTTPRLDDTRAEAGTAPGPVLVAIHQQPQRWKVPVHWPPGITGPEANAFLDAVAAANPAGIVASGHSHRHRRRRHRSLVVTESGSTRDFPGTWTGYVVHEGGIRQVVRRVAAPEAIRWTEATRRCFLGVWGLWSPGSLGHRCFSHAWPSRR